MAEYESDGDSDYEELMVPSSPPEKPPNAIQFYVEHNQGRLTDDQLRTEFRESLGQQEKQKWKTKHKKAKKRYQKLLQLYAEHNPDFNIEEYQQQSNSSSRRNKSGNKGSRKRKGGSQNQYGSRQQYVGIETYDDYGGNPQPAKKRRRKAQDSSSGNHTIDDLFKDINSGSKRVVRDPDKFRPSEDNRIQMQNLVQSMREAARKDWECNLKKEPAINTSKLLDTAVAELSKKLFYKYYLDDTDILEALRDWIHPLPDGSLPALKIRTELYRIIAKFGLHEYEQGSLNEYFQRSEDRSKDGSFRIDIHPNLKSFSKTCMYLWAHKKETNNNKVLLRKIIEKWIRTLTGSDTSYQDLHEDMREQHALIKARAKILSKQKRDFKFGKRKRAQIPEKAWHDFAVIPTNIVDDSGAGNPFGQRSHPLQDRMNKTFKRMSSSKQASKPSITGRKVRK